MASLATDDTLDLVALDDAGLLIEIDRGLEEADVPKCCRRRMTIW